MNYSPNKTYFEMLRLYKEHKSPDNCLVFCNEGGSRSGKTFDTFDLIIDFCLLAPAPLMIYVMRGTLTDCKDFTLEDFKNKIRARGLFDEKKMSAENTRPEYELNGCTIRFRGLDKMDKKEGFPSDIIFINEALSGVSKEQYENVIMRCRKLVILDWNPKYTEHWAFELEKQPNVFFTHSTFRDNPYLEKSIVQKILSYEPTAENIEAGTADDYRWKVYGQGMRAAQEGLVYPKITWIEEFPDDIEHTPLGMDFGFTNDPTALVRVGVRGNDLFLQELFYGPVVDANILYDLVKSHFGDKSYCYADSSDKYAQNPIGQVEALQMKGLAVIKAKKYSGSLLDGISIMQNYNIHIVSTKNFRTEANSYTWDQVNGIPINKPIDKFNHLWDAARYVMISEFRNYN